MQGKVEREEWRDANGFIHYKEFQVLERPNGKLFISLELDFQGTIIEKIVKIFNGKIVLVKDKTGEVIFGA